MKTDIKGEWAVVTGATGGIGTHFCRELAAMGCNVVLASNQREPLASMPGQLSREFGVECRGIYCDLTAPDAAERLLEEIDREGLQVSILINNAGIFSFRELLDTPERKIECFISLHVSAVTRLSIAFARRFRERGRGYILNMSSMSCWMPMPGIAMYSATKAYIRVFSRAMHYELRGSGVSVTVACPGGIATDLFGLPENLKKLAVGLGVLDTPDRFARKAIKKMLKGKMQYINGLLNRISIVFVGSTPTCVRMLVKSRMLDKGIVR